MPVKRTDKTAMPERNPDTRAHDFEEVNEGYNMSQALFEAERCLRCQDPICIEGCPVRIPIDQFIHKIAARDLHGAARILRDANPLSAICGRVCPQEVQCEMKCHMGTRYRPVAIGHLERFVSDWAREHPISAKGESAKPWRKEKVAVVGSGPSGLVCAGELARLGHPVTVYEALHAPGGVLRYGIPEFRLPNEVLDSEIEELRNLGVVFENNIIIGKTLTLDQLFDELGYSAVYVGTGAGLPKFLNIPGENLNGVYSANEFLTRINLMHAAAFPRADTPMHVGKRVAVIGSGNTAMDCVRSALRMGVEEGMVVYRRSEKEMTARVEEYQHAIEEGVKYHWLTNPIEILGNEEGWVTGLRCVKMELGEPDESGRARPIPIEGSEFVIPVDTVVLSIGTSPNPLLTRSNKDIETTSWGGLVVDHSTAETSRRHVYAGGDAVTGAATVILAAGAGKRAAHGIHEDLCGSRREPANECGCGCG